MSVTVETVVGQVVVDTPPPVTVDVSAVTGAEVVVLPVGPRGPAGPAGPASTVPGPEGPPGPGGVTDHGALTGLADPDHPIAAVVGLQTALDGKSPTSHTHTPAAVGAEPAGSVAAHESATDPHPAYLKPAEVLAGANVTVDTATTPGSVIINGAAGGGGGTTILDGTATPVPAVGSPGDYYLDSDDHILYGPRSSDAAPPPQGAFTTQVPGATYQQASGISLGHDFRFAVAGQVTGLRMYRPANATKTTHTLRAWTTGAVLRGPVQTVAETGTGWHSAPITPITVAAGESLRVAVELVANDPVAQDNTSPTDTVNGDVTLLKQAYYTLGSPAVPPGTNSAARVYVDVDFVKATPIWPVALISGDAAPATVTLTPGNGFVVASGSLRLVHNGATAQLTGYVKRTSGTLTQFLPAGSVPVEARPKVDALAACVSDNGGGAAGPMFYLTVDTAGGAAAVGMTGGPAWSTATWVYVGICWTI